MPNYLYVAKLKDEDEENGEEWGGRIKAMTKSNRPLFDDLKAAILSMMKNGVEHDVEVVKTQVKDVVDKIDQNKKQVENVRKELKKKLEKTDQNQVKIREEMGEMKEELKKN